LLLLFLGYAYVLSICGFDATIHAEAPANT
jgi:hypothetical protein